MWWPAWILLIPKVCCRKTQINTSLRLRWEINIILSCIFLFLCSSRSETLTWRSGFRQMTQTLLEASESHICPRCLRFRSDLCFFLSAVCNMWPGYTLVAFLSVPADQPTLGPGTMRPLHGQSPDQSHPRLYITWNPRWMRNMCVFECVRFALVVAELSPPPQHFFNPAFSSSLREINGRLVLVRIVTVGSVAAY